MKFDKSHTGIDALVVSQNNKKVKEDTT